MKDQIIAYIVGQDFHRQETVVSHGEIQTKICVVPRYRKYANQYGVSGFKRVN